MKFKSNLLSAMLFNAAGQLICNSYSIAGNKILLDENLPAGLYIVHVQGKEKLAVGKVVVLSSD